MLRLITRIAHNPYLNLLAGLILLLTAGHEMIVSVEEGLGSHHGLAFFGLMQLLKSLPEVVHGADGVAKFSEASPRNRHQA